MKTKLLIVLIFVSVSAQAKINVDSIKQAALKPLVDDYLVKANALTALLKNTSDVNLIKQYAGELCDLSDEMRATIKSFFPHGGGEMLTAPALTPGGQLAMGYTLTPYYGTTHTWEEGARSIRDYANQIKLYCKTKPVKRQKKIAGIEEEMQAMTAV
jgi:hypothetical protein